MKTAFKYLVFLFLFIALGCNTESTKKKSEYFNEVDSLTFRYTLMYNENIDTTIITAYFYKVPQKKLQKERGDFCYVFPPIKLKNGSIVLFNNMILKCNERHKYSKAVKGFISGGTFKWRNGSGNEDIQVVPASKRIAFPEIRTLNKNFEIAFRYVGAPIEKDEWIQLSLWDKDGHPTSVGVSCIETFLTSPVNQTYKDGPTILWLERTRRIISKSSNKMKGEISTVYRAKDAIVNVVSKPIQSDPPRVKAGNNPE